MLNKEKLKNSLDLEERNKEPSFLLENNQNKNVYNNKNKPKRFLCLILLRFFFIENNSFLGKELVLEKNTEENFDYDNTEITSRMILKIIGISFRDSVRKDLSSSQQLEFSQANEKNAIEDNLLLQEEFEKKLNSFYANEENRLEEKILKILNSENETFEKAISFFLLKSFHLLEDGNHIRTINNSKKTASLPGGSLPPISGSELSFNSSQNRNRFDRNNRRPVSTSSLSRNFSKKRPFSAIKLSEQPSGFILVNKNKRPRINFIECSSANSKEINETQTQEWLKKENSSASVIKILKETSFCALKKNFQEIEKKNDENTQQTFIRRLRNLLENDLIIENFLQIPFATETFKEERNNLFDQFSKKIKNNDEKYFANFVWINLIQLYIDCRLNSETLKFVSFGNKKSSAHYTSSKESKKMKRGIVKKHEDQPYVSQNYSPEGLLIGRTTKYFEENGIKVITPSFSSIVCSFLRLFSSQEEKNEGCFGFSRKGTYWIKEENSWKDQKLGCEYLDEKKLTKLEEIKKEIFEYFCPSKDFSLNNNKEEKKNSSKVFIQERIKRIFENNNLRNKIGSLLLMNYITVSINLLENSEAFFNVQTDNLLTNIRPERFVYYGDYVIIDFAANAESLYQLINDKKSLKKRQSKDNITLRKKTRSNDGQPSENEKDLNLIIKPQDPNLIVKPQERKEVKNFQINQTTKFSGLWSSCAVLNKRKKIQLIELKENRIFSNSVFNPRKGFKRSSSLSPELEKNHLKPTYSFSRTVYLNRLGDLPLYQEGLSYFHKLTRPLALSSPGNINFALSNPLNTPITPISYRVWKGAERCRRCDPEERHRRAEEIKRQIRKENELKIKLRKQNKQKQKNVKSPLNIFHSSSPGNYLNNQITPASLTPKTRAIYNVDNKFKSTPTTPIYISSMSAQKRVFGASVPKLSEIESIKRKFIISTPQRSPLINATPKATVSTFLKAQEPTPLNSSISTSDVINTKTPLADERLGVGEQEIQIQIDKITVDLKNNLSLATEDRTETEENSSGLVDEEAKTEESVVKEEKQPNIILQKNTEHPLVLENSYTSEKDEDDIEKKKKNKIFLDLELFSKKKSESFAEKSFPVIPKEYVDGKFREVLTIEKTTDANKDNNISANSKVDILISTLNEKNNDPLLSEQNSDSSEKRIITEPDENKLEELFLESEEEWKENAHNHFWLLRQQLPKRNFLSESSFKSSLKTTRNSFFENSKKELEDKELIKFKEKWETIFVDFLKKHNEEELKKHFLRRKEKWEQNIDNLTLSEISSFESYLHNLFSEDGSVQENTQIIKNLSTSQESELSLSTRRNQKTPSRKNTNFSRVRVISPRKISEKKKRVFKETTIKTKNDRIWEKKFFVSLFVTIPAITIFFLILVIKYFSKKSSTSRFNKKSKL